MRRNKNLEKVNFNLTLLSLLKKGQCVNIEVWAHGPVVKDDCVINARKNCNIYIMYINGWIYYVDYVNIGKCIIIDNVPSYDKWQKAGIEKWQMGNILEKLFLEYETILYENVKKQQNEVGNGFEKKPITFSYIETFENALETRFAA